VQLLDALDRREPQRHTTSPPTGWPERVGSRLARGHPVLAVAAVILGAYLVLTAVLVASGLLATHVLAHGPVGHWDDHVSSWFVGHRESTLNRLSGDATFMANTLGIVVVAAVVTVVPLVLGWRRRALLIVIGLAVELSVFLSSNYLVARPRPPVNRLGSTPSTYSWPSGHVAATFVLYGSIAVLVMYCTRRRLLHALAWLVAVGLTTAVALSRIYRGEHHVTDAVAGVVLGFGAVWAATIAIRAADAAHAAHASRGGHASRGAGGARPAGDETDVAPRHHDAVGVRDDAGRSPASMR
jgi:membrane-associated phospholipid phosphatase